MEEVKVYLWERTGDKIMAKVLRSLGAGHGALDVPWKGEAFYISWFADMRAVSSVSKKGEEKQFSREAAWATGFEYVWDRKHKRMIPNPSAWHKRRGGVTHVPLAIGNPTFKSRGEEAASELTPDHLEAFKDAANKDPLKLLVVMRPRKLDDDGKKLTLEVDQPSSTFNKLQPMKQRFLTILKAAEDDVGEKMFEDLTSIDFVSSGWKLAPTKGHMTHDQDRPGEPPSEAISIPCASKRTGQPATWPEQLWGLSADSIMRWWISLMRLEPGNAQRRYNALSRRNNCDGAVVAGLIHGGGEIFSGSPRNLVQGTKSLKEWANAIKTEVESLERHYRDFKNEVPWLRSRQLLKGIPTYKEWKKFSAVSGKPRVLTCELYEVDALVKEYHQCREKLQLQDERFDADELAAWTGDTRAVFSLRVKSLRILADIHKQIHKLWRRNPHSSRMPFMLQLYGALIDEVWGGTGMLPQETGKQYRSLVH